MSKLIHFFRSAGIILVLSVGIDITKNVYNSIENDRRNIRYAAIELTKQETKISDIQDLLQSVVMRPDFLARIQKTDSDHQVQEAINQTIFLEIGSLKGKQARDEEVESIYLSYKGNTK